MTIFGSEWVFAGQECWLMQVRQSVGMVSLFIVDVVEMNNIRCLMV